MGFYRSKNSDSKGPTRKNTPVTLPTNCNPYGVRLYWYGEEKTPSYFALSTNGLEIARLDRPEGEENWTLYHEMASAIEGVAAIRAAEDIREGRGAPEVLNRVPPPRWIVSGEKPGGHRIAGQSVGPSHGRKT